MKHRFMAGLLLILACSGIKAAVIFGGYDCGQP
jgi:hypothetical protein